MSDPRPPWDLTKLPGWEKALCVDVEQAEGLDGEAFWRLYVLRNRPCLIKGAIRQWPAFQRWTEGDYLERRVGSVEVPGNCLPRVEAFGLRSKDKDLAATKLTHDRQLPGQRVADWLPRLRSPDDGLLFIELRPAQAGARVLGNDLSVAGVRFPFLPTPPRPRYGLYSGWAAMLYRNSYSDWHFHPATDAIMCQVAGTKDVALLPPTQLSWDQIVSIHVDQGKVYDVDFAKAPLYRSVRPYHVVVEPGDGLFLPVNWWHAVQGRPREFGITTPITWDSPYRDLRQPATRHFLRLLWRRHKMRATAALLESVCFTAANRTRECVSPAA
jgi:hypothetical protein